MMQQARSFTLNADDLPAERAFNRYAATVYEPRATALTTAMTDRRISVDEWLRAMLVEVDFVVFTAVQLGAGGADKLTDADLAYIRRVTAEQHAYLRKWAGELKARADERGYLALTAGLIGAAVVGVAAKTAISGALSTATLITRALLYAKTAQSFLMTAYTLSLGMPVLPAYPRDNSSRCLMNDACAWEIVQMGSRDWDCYWRLSIGVESCPNCLRRAEVWNPLKIVTGVIQPYNSAGLFAA